jgi:hypothetical protein
MRSRGCDGCCRQLPSVTSFPPPQSQLALLGFGRPKAGAGSIVALGRSTVNAGLHHRRCAQSAACPRARRLCACQIHSEALCGCWPAKRLPASDNGSADISPLWPALSAASYGLTRQRQEATSCVRMTGSCFIALPEEVMKQHCTTSGRGRRISCEGVVRPASR